VTPAQIALLSVREFLVLAGGLSEAARWPKALRDAPERADTPEAIASIFGSYNG
jgi:hypothetical protein